LTQNNILTDYFLTITPSWFCNLRCKFCFQNCFEKKPCLSDEIIYNRLLPIYSKTKQLLILGGEITIIPGMKDYIIFLKRNFPQLDIWVVTNGLKFDEEWIDLATILGLKVEYSLNATNGLIYSKGLSNGNGEKIWEMIYSNLIKLINRQQQEDLHIVNVISMVITNDTISDIENFVKLALRLRVNVKFLYDCTGVENTPEIQDSLVKILKLKQICKEKLSIRVVNQPVQLNKQPLEKYTDNDAFDKMTEHFRQLLQDSTYKNVGRIKDQELFGRYSEQEERSNSKSCYMPWKGLVVIPTGHVLACSRLPNYILGDLNYESIEEILNSDAAINLRKMIQNNNYRFCRSDCEFNRNPSSSIPAISYSYVPKYKKLFEQQQYADALPLYIKCVETNDNDAELIYHLAYCYQMINKNEEALKYYEYALEKGFSEFWIRYNRGSLLQSIGEYEYARNDLEKAVNLQPDHEGARKMLQQLSSNKAQRLN